MDTDDEIKTETFNCTLQGINLLKDDVDLGVGVLTITESYVEWKGQDQIVNWDYQTILMHAVSLEGEPSVYCQLKGDDEDDLLEATFKPANSGDVEEIFKYLSKGAELNPDSPEHGLEDIEAGNFIFNRDEINGDIRE